MTSDTWSTCPTRRLLLACLHHPPPDSHLLRALLDAPLDWERFIQLAERHQVVPLASRALAGQATVPPAITTALSTQRTRNARRALTQLAALGELLAQFHAARVPVLPVKGPLLAAQLHGDPGLRQCGDLDLLVAPEHVAQAQAIIHDAGYRRQHPEFPLSPRQYQAFLTNYNQMTHRQAAPPITVELHWRWFRNRYFFPTSIDDIIERGHTHKVGGLTVPSLPPEDLLLYLCAHGAKHAWYNLKWLADIPPLLARLTDTQKLHQRTQQLGLQRVLAQTLLLCQELLAVSLAPPLATLIHVEPSARPLADQARRVMLRDDRRDNRIRATLQRWIYMNRLRTAPSYRWRETVGYFSNCEDWRRLPLPDRLFWLYPPLRPLLWLSRRWGNDS